MKFRRLRLRKKKSAECFESTDRRNRSSSREPAPAEQDMGVRDERDRENTGPYGSKGSAQEGLCERIGADGRMRATSPECSMGCGCGRDPLQDKGNAPYVFDMATEVRISKDKKRALWTGKHLQVAIEKISLPTEEPKLNEGADVAMYVVWGEGYASIGRQHSNMGERHKVRAGSCILIPDGAYYSVASSGAEPLDVIAYYAPRGYPFGYIEK